MRVAWLMLDGVGLVAPHPLHPFQFGSHPTLEHLGIAAANPQSHEQLLTRAIDACLGVNGLPQSGTGQTTILTGQNAAAAMKRHYGPWVSPSLRTILERNVLRRISERGGSVRLGNYYPHRYLEALSQGATRLNAIATAALGAGARLEGSDGLGIPPMLYNPQGHSDVAQVRAWARAFVHSPASLTIFDEWWTDHVGHEMNLEAGQAFAALLEVFCQVVLEERADDVLFLVTSDHGNFEDLGVKTHTVNPVPLAVVGPGALEFADVQDLTGIAPALARALHLGK